METEIVRNFQDLSDRVKGKIVSGIQERDDFNSRSISIIFDDGSLLMIEYSWIYEFNFIAGDKTIHTERRE
jgi:hypothetical protein